MSCEHVICARCAGPVVEGRCPTCRAIRAEMHHPSGINLQFLTVLFALLLALLTAVAVEVAY
ncbi:MAG: hypothetical protein ACRDN9_10585 [Streptosporangiaceae bacterium]